MRPGEPPYLFKLPQSTLVRLVTSVQFGTQSRTRHVECAPSVTILVHELGRLPATGVVRQNSVRLENQQHATFVSQHDLLYLRVIPCARRKTPQMGDSGRDWGHRRGVGITRSRLQTDQRSECRPRTDQSANLHSGLTTFCEARRGYPPPDKWSRCWTVENSMATYPGGEVHVLSEEAEGLPRHRAPT